MTPAVIIARRYQEKQRAAGLCMGCGKGPLATRFYCGSCAAKRNAQSAIRRGRPRAAWLAEGVGL
jgi:hypothetical protein